MSKKREKRIAQLSKEYEDAVVDQALTKSYEAIANDNLFVVDRDGSAKRKKKAMKELIPKATNTFISPTEQKIINKYITKGFPSQTKKAYGEDIVEISSKKRKGGKVLESSLTDIWGEVTPSHDDSEESKKKKMRVALPGQSYHPNPRDHQNLVAEAVAIEMKLQEATNPKSTENSTKALIPAEYSVNNFHLQNQTARDITNLLLSNNNDDDDDEDDDEDNDSSDDDSDDNNSEEGEEIEGENKKKKKKVPEKLTKAQLNKKKAQRMARYEQRQLKAQEIIDKSIDQLPNILNELEQLKELNEFQSHMKKLVKRKKLRQLTKKAVSLNERRQRLRSSLKKKNNNKQEDKEGTNNDNSEEMEVFEEDEDDNNHLKPFDVSSVPLSDELNSSLRKVIPKGIAVKDYMFEMIDNGYMNPKRKKGFSIKDHPYLAKKVKWIPKYKY